MQRNDQTTQRRPRRGRIVALAATIAMLATLAPLTTAAAAVNDVTVNLARRGGSLAVEDVTFRPGAGVSGGQVDLRLTSSAGVLTSTQPDPAGDGAGFVVSEIGWAPTDAAVRMQVEKDGSEVLDLTLPQQTLVLGSPNVVSGRTIPGADVRVVIGAPSASVTRTTTSSSNGSFSVDATAGPGETLPKRWQFGTSVRVSSTGQVDGTNIVLVTHHSLVDAEVVLSDGPDQVTFKGDTADIEAFGRRTMTGTQREDTVDVEPGAEVLVDGAGLELVVDPAVDVTGWDPETGTASGTGTPGAQVRIDFIVFNARFRGSGPGTATVGSDGRWSVTTSYADRGPFTGAVVTATDPTPAADGATYAREVRFGDATTARSLAPEEVEQAPEQEVSSRAAVTTVLRRLHLDGTPGLSMSALPGTGSRHVVTATTDDGAEHVADVEGVSLFGASGVSLQPDEFTPELDLARAFDLEVDRGGERSSFRFERFDLTWDPTVTGFRGTIGPGQEIRLTASVPGWSQQDAENATAVAAADGTVDVALGASAPGASAEVAVGDYETGRTEGGFDRPRPVVVPLGDDATTARRGRDIQVDVAPRAPEGAVLELLAPGALSISAAGPGAFVEVPGDGRRTMPVPTDVAVALTTGPAVGPDDDVDVMAASVRGNRTSTTRVPVTPILCLDPADLPAGCDAALPTPYMVVPDTPIGGAFSLALADTAPPKVTRAEGTDRVATSVAISRATHPFVSLFGTKLVDDVIVANSANFPDALAAAPLAEAVGAPVLLNPAAALDPAVARELQRIAPSRVVIMGGPVAISAQVEQAIRDLGVRTIDRLAGQDRFQTAALAATAAVDEWQTQGEDTAGHGVLVALGTHPVSQNRAWPDALAAGPLAASSRQPILLTRQDGVPTATAAAIAELGAASVTVLGGPVAIPQATADELGRGRSLRRIGGDDRYHTSTLLADEAWEWGGTRSNLWVATGAAFPDGLAASAAAATSGAMLVLAPPADLAAAPKLTSWLDARRRDTSFVSIAGGPVAISAKVQDQLAARLD